MTDKGSLIVISGPAGSGKGTIVKLLLQDESYCVSISTTSRQPRGDDIPGVTYNFVTAEQFGEMITRGELAEFAEYVGNYYGTPVKSVQELISSGKNVILEIETQGALQIKSRFPEAILIWLSPPDYETLEARLRGRGTNTEEDIKKRLTAAKREMQFLPYYDYIVVNEKGMANEAAERIREIVRVNKLSTKLNTDFPSVFYN
jgi:guanylate kinase